MLCGRKFGRPLAALAAGGMGAMYLMEKMQGSSQHIFGVSHMVLS
ncbi:MAG: hypothetical protein OXC44_08405 [Proteobacteria bacterium]|nr:hypothetical protein [Pseudomonadota bacterium]